MFFVAWLLRTLFKTAWRIAPTSFLGSTFGIANNTSQGRSGKRREEGVGEDEHNTHDNQQKENWARHFYAHFCMTGKRPG
jgi:hypothetical protein